MKFTGRNLQWVKYAMELAVDELHNQIATCPDVVHYAEDIERCENQQKQLRAIIARIDTELGPTDTFNPNKGEEE